MQSNYEILLGDSLQVLSELDDNSIDSIVTDPPYGLSFMAKKWDYDVPSVGLWEQVLRVLKPGGHLLSFGGTRTYHRMVVNIEDAGFDIRDQIQWLYGSGFPKSLNVLKKFGKTYACQLLKNVNVVEQESKHSLVGSSGEKIGSVLVNAQIQVGEERVRPMGIGVVVGSNDPTDILLLESTELIDSNMLLSLKKKLEDHSKYMSSVITLTELKTITGLKIFNLSLDPNTLRSITVTNHTALKPANEPIVLARKPLSEKTIVDNVLRWGTGGLNIDECRLEAQPRMPGNIKPTEVSGRHGIYGQDKRTDRQLEYKKKHDDKPQGRWPANVILDEVAGEMLDVQSGVLKSGQLNAGHKQNQNSKLFPKAKSDKVILKNYGGDTGGASRFFYCAKSSKRERNAGLDTFYCIKLDCSTWHVENMEVAQSLLKVILESIQNLNIAVSGDHIMVTFQKDSLSTIKTKIQQITELKTWNWLIHSLTNGSTQDVSLKESPGINLVHCAKNLKESMTRIGTLPDKVGSLITDVAPAIYQELLKIVEKKEYETLNNFHSTVKPLKIMAYLCKLITPPNGIILDPFMGSGTTGIAAISNGFRFMGIEREAEYIEIAARRIENAEDLFNTTA